MDMVPPAVDGFGRGLELGAREVTPLSPRCGRITQFVVAGAVASVPVVSAAGVAVVGWQLAVRSL